MWNRGLPPAATIMGHCGAIFQHLPAGFCDSRLRVDGDRRPGRAESFGASLTSGRPANELESVVDDDSAWGRSSDRDGELNRSEQDDPACQTPDVETQCPVGEIDAHQWASRPFGPAVGR